MSTALNQLPEALAAETATKAKGGSLRRDTVRNVLRQRSAVIGLIILRSCS